MNLEKGCQLRLNETATLRNYREPFRSPSTRGPAIRLVRTEPRSSAERPTRVTAVARILTATTASATGIRTMLAASGNLHRGGVG